MKIYESGEKCSKINDHVEDGKIYFDKIIDGYKIKRYYPDNKQELSELIDEPLGYKEELCGPYLKN